MIWKVISYVNARWYAAVDFVFHPGVSLAVCLTHSRGDSHNLPISCVKIGLQPGGLAGKHGHQERRWSFGGKLFGPRRLFNVMSSTFPH